MHGACGDGAFRLARRCRRWALQGGNSQHWEPGKTRPVMCRCRLPWARPGGGHVGVLEMRPHPDRDVL